MSSAVASGVTSTTTSAEVLDLFVIGGGINGTGIAAEGSVRGLRVGLCEQGDLAGATSSASSKLIHGGLRYLEHYEFRLVREALAEREILMRMAPHLVRPLQFVLPHQPHLRPAWMIRTGLFLYDHLSQRNALPGSQRLNLKQASENPLRPEIQRAFSYYDCHVDDARLVVENALQAQAHGAEILVRWRCVRAQREDQHWRIDLQNMKTGAQKRVLSRTLVNASGPWAQQFVETMMTQRSPRSIRLIKGSHIVVPRFYAGEQAYILQNDDQRIVFVIPYQRDFTLIGTTDSLYQGDPAAVAMDAAERDYMLKIVNSHFQHQCHADDIVWDYAGVRPLCDDESDSPSAMTRDYTLELETGATDLPVLHIFGGKLTTYRRLALSALQRLTPWLPFDAVDTDSPALPGGRVGAHSWEQFQADFVGRYPYLPSELLQRWLSTYGARAQVMARSIHSEADLGRHFGASLYEVEVDFLRESEWASSTDDILWRRSKMGLHLTPEQVDELRCYLSDSSQPAEPKHAST